MAGGGDAAVAAAMGVDAEVVIVGGGIAGLATALALRRAGAANGGVLVLERHAELRATGAALIIFPNGWFAFRALGVARKLSSRYDAYETSKVTNLESGATQVFPFAGNKNKSESEGAAQEDAAGGARGGAAAGHHPLLVQARLHRHRARSRRLVGDRRPDVGRRRRDPSQGPDRLRRRALRGGAVAGPVGAGELRPVLRPRALHLPRRPRHEAGDPAVPLAGSQGRHGAHQRHRCLLVPHQRDHRRGGRHRRGPDEDPAGGHRQPCQPHAAGVPGRGAPLRPRQPLVGAAPVPEPVLPPRRRRRGGGARGRDGGRRRVPPDDARHSAGRVLGAGGRGGARARAGAGGNAGRGRGRVRGASAVARRLARRRGLSVGVGPAGRHQRPRRARAAGEDVQGLGVLPVRVPQARRHHVVRLRRPDAMRGRQEPQRVK